jgi:hypothetical protein
MLLLEITYFESPFSYVHIRVAIDLRRFGLRDDLSNSFSHLHVSFLESRPKRVIVKVFLTWSLCNVLVAPWKLPVLDLRSSTLILFSFRLASWRGSSLLRPSFHWIPVVWMNLYFLPHLISILLIISPVHLHRFRSFLSNNWRKLSCFPCVVRHQVVVRLQALVIVILHMDLLSE